jgi:hypothetical protein
VEKSRKQLKERKNRSKKIRGVKKVNFFFEGHVKVSYVLFVTERQCTYCIPGLYLCAFHVLIS